MHRYIPLIAAHEGFDKIDEKTVSTRQENMGKQVWCRSVSQWLFGLDHLVVYQRIWKKTHAFLWILGNLMLIMGFGFTIYLGIDKLYLNIQSRLITQRPEFYIALTTMILGAQFFYRWIFR